MDADSSIVMHDYEVHNRSFSALTLRNFGGDDRMSVTESVHHILVSGPTWKAAAKQLCVALELAAESSPFGVIDILGIDTHYSEVAQFVAFYRVTVPTTSPNHGGGKRDLYNLDSPLLAPQATAAAGTHPAATSGFGMQTTGTSGSDVDEAGSAVAPVVLKTLTPASTIANPPAGVPHLQGPTTNPNLSSQLGSAKRGYGDSPVTPVWPVSQGVHGPGSPRCPLAKGQSVAFIHEAGKPREALYQRMCRRSALLSGLNVHILSMSCCARNPKLDVDDHENLPIGFVFFIHPQVGILSLSVMMALPSTTAPLHRRQNGLALMCFNIWHNGGLSLKDCVSTIRLCDPDVVVLQEVDEELVSVLAAVLHMPYHCATASILSRHPLKVSPVAPQCCEVELPGNDMMLVYNAHCPADPYPPYVLVRQSEAEAIKAHDALQVPYVRQVLQEVEQAAALMKNGSGRKELAEGRFVQIICGDFNCPSHLDLLYTGPSDSVGRWVPWGASKAMTEEGHFTDTFRAVRKQQQPFAKDPNFYTWTPYVEAEPKGQFDRIDFIYAKLEVNGKRIPEAEFVEKYFDHEGTCHIDDEMLSKVIASIAPDGGAYSTSSQQGSHRSPNNGVGFKFPSDHRAVLFTVNL